MTRRGLRGRAARRDTVAWEIAHFFTADRWRADGRAAPAIEVRLAPGDVQRLADDVQYLGGAIVEACCARLEIPEAPGVVVTMAELAEGEYEVALAGSVRVAGSLATSWHSWWRDHPVPGPRGRSGSVPCPSSVDAEIAPAAKIGRAVEEAVWDNPGPLLWAASASAVIDKFAADAPVWGEIDEYTAILRALASRRVPLRDVDRLAEGMRELEAANEIRRVEVLSCRCRPYEITVRVGQELLEELRPDDEDGSLQAELLPFLHDGLYAELGVGFPDITFHVAPDLSGRQYEVAINGLPRAGGEIPRGTVLVDAEPSALGEASAATFVNPANGAVTCWVDEARAGEWGSGLITWNTAEFLVLHLAGCMREAASEFADLAWTQQLFENLDFTEGRGDLVAAIDRLSSREVVSAVFSRLVQEGVTIRDLAFLLERLVELGVATQGSARSNGRAGPAPTQASGVVPVVAHVRREMKDRLSHLATQSWEWGADDDAGLRPVSREMAVVVLVDDDEPRVVQTGDGDGVEPAATGPLLRQLRRVLESWERRTPPVVLTSSAARPHVRRAVAAQFPRVKVLAREELTPDVRLERVGVS
jgi:flagellar biosynthesis component FlhA